MRDRAAARADLDQVDARDEHGQPRAALEAVHARGFEAVRDQRLAADRDARFRGGAAHVEREDLVDAVDARGVERREHAARRARFEQQDRRLGRRLARSEAAARDHDAQRRVRREIVHAAVEAPQVFGDERLHVGVRRRSSTCARTRGSRARCPTRSTPRAAGKRSRIAVGDLLLVRVVHVRVQQAHRDRFDARARRSRRAGARSPSPSSGCHDFAARVEPLVDFAAFVERRRAAAGSRD